MKYSFWPDGDYPIYMDPDYSEILELAKTRPDTLRIMDGDDHFGVASGFGNTHSSVCNGVAKMLGVKRWLGAFDFILYREYGQWYFNPMWHWETTSDRVPWNDKLVQLSDRGMLFIKDFVMAYDDCNFQNYEE